MEGKNFKGASSSKGGLCGQTPADSCATADEVLYFLQNCSISGTGVRKHHPTVIEELLRALHLSVR